MRVNGETVRDPERWVEVARDRVTVDGRPVAARERIYLALHKPRGYLTTRRDPAGRPTIYDLLSRLQRTLIAVGRLDLDSSGLLLLTSDTDFAERMTNPDFKVPKLYRVKAATRLREEQLERLRQGVELKDGLTRPAQARRLGDPGGKTVFEIALTEGRNRQVRRMVEAVGSKVLRLERTAIGPVRLGDLEEGKARPLSRDELRRLPVGGARDPLSRSLRRRSRH